MIPIRPRRINEYFFCTNNICDIINLTAYDFLSEQCLKCYGLKEDTLSLFVDKTKSNDNNNVFIKNYLIIFSKVLLLILLWEQD